MALVRAITRPSLCRAYSHGPIRGYAAKATVAKKEAPPVLESKQSTLMLPSIHPSIAIPAPLSCCPTNTLLTGLNYLKGQPPVLALPDEEYPPWLWTLLQPKVDVDHGPGSLAEKRRMKRERGANIKYANFLKTQ